MAQKEKISSGHIWREARALAACDGYEFGWNALSRFDKERYRIEAEEIADYLYKDRICIRGCCGNMSS
jgi:hypothetical protein